MYCRNCAREVHPQAVACPGCGVPPLLERKFCPACAAPTQPNQVLCVKCGVAFGGLQSSKSYIAAGLFGIFLGSLGIHKFYLGYTQEGVIMLLVSVLGGLATCGAAFSVMHIIGLIEGILYLTKSEEEFDRLYVRGRHPWF